LHFSGKKLTAGYRCDTFVLAIPHSQKGEIMWKVFCVACAASVALLGACVSQQNTVLDPPPLIYRDNGLTAGNGEKFGLIRRSDGQPNSDESRALLEAMINAVKQ
jgi:hypothetical protein